MQKNLDILGQQCLPGERQWLRSALLTDQDGMLTATRLRLTRLARARGVDPHVVDDVVQETLLEAWSHLERLYAPAGFHAWIDEICRNICRRATHKRKIDLLRNASLPRSFSVGEHQASDEEGDLLTNLPAPDSFDPLEELSRQDLMVLLDQALGALPQATRQVVEMCHLLELPHSEVAARLDISISALDTRLHRARHQLRQILSGPLRRSAEEFGLALDEAVVEGWQETRLWCPLCACHRLQGCFQHVEGEVEGPNLHLRCPDCSQRYGQDTVHSMGLVSLANLHSFRPAWKRTMQGLADRMVQALPQGLHPCVYCGESALVQVQGSDTEATLSPPGPYPFWIHMYCVHCGRDVDASGDVPSVDQLVYWSHPLTRQFLQQHPRLRSEPGRLVEHDGETALRFQIADLESTEHVTVLTHRQTLRVLTLTTGSLG